MVMDPKQERVLRDGTAGEADQPRQTDREAVRAQAERPPIDKRPQPRRRTVAVADVRVNLPSGTPVEQLAREGGAQRVPEVGRSRNEIRNDTTEVEGAPRTREPVKEASDAPAVEDGEARRVMKARREHSKGDGNFPRVEPRADLLDEREEDRTPRDLPKSRDDRSAPKGNVSAGQSDRNPALEVRDDHQPVRPRRARPTPAPASTRRKPAAARRRQETMPTRSGAGKKKPVASQKKPRRRAAARGSAKPPTKRAVRGGGPRTRSGPTRGGKR
jgi:hypothetical protein